MSIFAIYDQKIVLTIIPDNISINVQSGTTGLELFDQNPEIVAMLVNNDLMSLCEPITMDAIIEPVLRTSEMAIQILQDTIAVVVQCAACAALPKLVLQQKYSLHKAMFFQYEDLYLTDSDLENINYHLNQLVNLNLRINKITVTHEQALQETAKLNHQKAHDLLLALNNPFSEMLEIFYNNDKFKLLWSSTLLKSTADIKNLFKIQRFNKGLLVFYSQDYQKVDSEPIRNSVSFQKDIMRIVDNYVAQARSIELDNVASVNKLTTQPKVLSDRMALCEYNIEKQIAEVVQRVTKDTKIIFLAGPSSSGKTTTANRITCHLRCKGFEPLRVSMDDYYKSPLEVPRIEGTEKPDFEHLHSLDIDRLQKNLSELLEGKETVMAHYDFATGTPGNGAKYKLPQTGILVIEGIHALNDEITQFVPDENKLRIFIQPIGALAWDETRIIDYFMSRLMRRMCRDYIFRGRSAESTIDSWASVRQGEDRWIFPNQVKADVYLNTSVMYEQFVLRTYAVPLLLKVPHQSPHFAIARRMLKMLQPLQPIPDHLVPEMSTLREFLPGGSDYEQFFY